MSTRHAARSRLGGGPVGLAAVTVAEGTRIVHPLVGGETALGARTSGGPALVGPADDRTTPGTGPATAHAAPNPASASTFAPSGEVTVPMNACALVASPPVTGAIQYSLGVSAASGIRITFTGLDAPAASVA